MRRALQFSLAIHLGVGLSFYNGVFTSERKIYEMNIERGETTLYFIDTPAEKLVDDDPDGILPKKNKAENTNGKITPKKRGLKTSAAALGDNPSPGYPYLALQKGWEGTVLVRVEVDREGRALSGFIKKSSGYRILDREALKTVLKWKFSAAMEKGEKIRSWIEVPITFRVENPPLY